MFKPTAPQCSRVRLKLTTKAVNKGYYKGNRTGSMGAHTRNGKYVIDYRKVRTYVCPEPAALENFKLTPFVTKRIEPPKARSPQAAATGQATRAVVKSYGGFSGNDYLTLLEEHNPGEVRELSGLTDGTGEQGEEMEEEPERKIHFGRSWEDLSKHEQARYKAEEDWDRIDALAEESVLRWYEGVKKRTAGFGLGGSSKRKVRV